MQYKLQIAPGKSKRLVCKESKETNILKRIKMGYIKEPKGVDFVVEPHVLTEEDQKIISKAIALYKATGKITRAPRSRKTHKTGKKVKR